MTNTTTTPSDSPPVTEVEVIPQIRDGTTVYLPAFYLNGSLITITGKEGEPRSTYEEAAKVANAAISEIERLWAMTGHIPYQESPAPSPVAPSLPAVKSPIALLVAAKPAASLLVLATFPPEQKGKAAQRAKELTAMMAGTTPPLVFCVIPVFDEAGVVMSIDEDAEFHEWATRERMFVRKKDGEYIAQNVRIAQRAWHARASLQYQQSLENLRDNTSV